MSWDDTPLPEDAEILAAFPTRSGRHDLYQEAMRLVGACHSKWRLVSLVTWLLLKAEAPRVEVKKPNDCTVAGCKGERMGFKLVCPKHVPAEPVASPMPSRDWTPPVEMAPKPAPPGYRWDGWKYRCGMCKAAEGEEHDLECGWVDAIKAREAEPSSGDDRVAEAIRFLSYAEERLHSAGEEPTENRTYGDILCALAQLRLVPSPFTSQTTEKKT